MTDYLTSGEVAALLHKSRRTVHRMAHVGALPLIQQLPGSRGAMLFDGPEVRRLVDEGDA